MAHLILRREALRHLQHTFINIPTRQGVRLTQIMNGINNHDYEVPIMKRDIWNRRQKLAKRTLNKMFLIQALLFTLKNSPDFICYHDVNGENRINRLLWIHRDMLGLFRVNFEVLLMDMTFKINRFQVKLFNIMGVTLLNTTFHLAFVFLTHKETADFT